MKKQLNKITVSFLMLASASAMTSCDSLFKDAPINEISEKSVWGNPQLLDEYENSWYRNMSNGFSTYVPSIALVKSMSRYYLPWFGDQITVGKSTYYNAGYGDLLKGNSQELTKWASNVWNNYMTQVQSINTLLENLGEISDGDQKNRIIGEAHFLRGYYYYMLWRMFGGVMIIDHTYDPLKNAEKFPRASYQQMVDFIVSEADEAAKYLPVKHESTETGRATKGAALMLKAKTYFWASSEVFQNKDEKQYYLGFTDDQSRNMLEKAKKAYEDLMALNAYSLIPISATIQDGIKDEYRKIFLTKNSQESILEVQHSDDGDYANKFGHKLDRDACSPYFTGTTLAYLPTQNHVDEYGMQKDKTYDPQHPYENRDYRFYANVLYDGCTFRNHVMDIHYTNRTAGVDLTKYGSSTSADFLYTGYYMGKFVDETQTIDNNETYASKQNYIIWRYAEVLLDYAEVCYRLGDADLALTYLNKTRERVHMPGFDAATEENIRNERRVELAFEETTYWDLFRWGIANEKMNGASNPLKAMRVDVTEVAGNEPVTKYTISNLNRFPKRVRVFDDKQYYLPIPWSEIKYQGVEQNPGWTEQ
mgnify:FL=1